MGHVPSAITSRWNSKEETEGDQTYVGIVILKKWQDHTG